jgi:endonuclease III
MLDELPIRDSYSSDENDLVSEFYNPVLARSVSYDRITGYFSPNILAVVARGFAGLINNKGRIRILSSVEVSKETYDAITDSESSALDESITFDMNLLENELQRDYVKVFMYLYKAGLLELKIAVLRDSAGILHQKIGIVKDEVGNAISFSGSNNETYSGAVNNLEEFKVFKNWTISTSPYFTSDRNKFEKYWSNQVDGVKVIPINDAMKERFVKIVGVDDDIHNIIRRIQQLEQKNDVKVDKDSGRQLRDYQIAAIEHWVDNGYRSIFEMATGTGKTFTAINALRRFREDNSFLRVVIVVPLTTLTVQWQEDIKR